MHLPTSRTASSRSASPRTDPSTTRRRGASLVARASRRGRRQDGMTTAEYAVGTLGACTVGGVLVKIGQSEWFGDLVKDVIDNIPNVLPNLF
ncbi:DUF4244 domain-containing protein [Aeromicrobium sp. CnD17-E]|uniref:DUF4244 domain-containing protein n=1 Tax=Aeromicrobium sp. CnD17-E TaxID=2954487 RepID=UPI0021138174|nr:DUF4244 domain-containing protein [Aeromicrobium sp. CnD17-E]